MSFSGNHPQQSPLGSRRALILGAAVAAALAVGAGILLKAGSGDKATTAIGAKGPGAQNGKSISAGNPESGNSGKSASSAGSLKGAVSEGELGNAPKSGHVGRTPPPPKPDIQAIREMAANGVPLDEQFARLGGKNLPMTSGEEGAAPASGESEGTLVAAQPLSPAEEAHQQRLLDIENRATSDPEAAAKYVSSLPDDLFRMEAIEHVKEQWLEKQPPMASDADKRKSADEWYGQVTAKAE